MIVFIDFETRSKISLPDAGMYRYAEDPSTEVFCLGVKVDNLPAKIWVSPFSLARLTLDQCFNLPVMGEDNLRDLVSDPANEFHAFNAGFERCIWSNIMVKRLGFPEIHLRRWRCTASQSNSFSLPQNLDGACNALGLAAKDKAGYSIMMKLCKPRKALKADKERDADWETRTYWHEDPEDILANCRYCLNDVEIEYALHKRLPTTLSPSEQEVWFQDQIINDRGINVDMPSVRAVQKRCAEYRTIIEAELVRITGGAVTTASQVTRILALLKDTYGVELEALDKNVVEDTLKREDLDPTARRILEIRVQLSQTSTAKFDAIADMVCADGRIHGEFKYWGAGTGRWSGQGVQLQNLPRKCDVEAPAAFQLFDAQTLILLYGDVFSGAKKCIRPVMCAPEGRTLVVLDYASIEGRVLAWLAGEHGVIQDYIANRDMYKVSYSVSFGTPYDQVTHDQRTIGKPIELGLGYGGWIGALRAMGETYHVDFPDDDECKRIILAWRDSRPATTALWDNLWQAALRTVQRGQPHAVGKIMFGLRDNWLHMRLPSGRLLAYYSPEVELMEDPYGRVKDTLTFMSIDGRTKSPTYKKWTRIKTWYGVITENAVQAIARDLLADALIRLEANGFPIVLHVHDEIGAEVSIGQEREDEFKRIMTTIPEWAAGLPIDAAGWTGKRYRKD